MRKLLIKFILPILARYHYIKLRLKIFKTRKRPMNLESQNLLEMLSENGYVLYRNEEFRRVADEILAEYFHTVDCGFNLDSKFVISKMNSTAEKIGNTSCRVSLRDPLIRRVICSATVWEVISGYIGRACLRESPLVENYNFVNAAEATRDIISYAVSYHTDYYRQLNIMLLLTDVTEQDTCTEYAVGSQKRNVFLQGTNIGYPKTNSLLSKKKWQIEKITGLKGDVIIMDTTGIHRVRVVEGSNRKILVGVLNPSYPFHGYSEEVKSQWFDSSEPGVTGIGIKGI